MTATAALSASARPAPAPTVFAVRVLHAALQFTMLAAAIAIALACPFLCVRLRR